MGSSSQVERAERGRFQLRFESLIDARRAYVFPCNAAGQVDLDALGHADRNNYLYARAVMGREVSVPKVHASTAP